MCCLKCILINHIVAHSRESCWCSSMNILPSFLFSLFFFFFAELSFFPALYGWFHGVGVPGCSNHIFYPNFPLSAPKIPAFFAEEFSFWWRICHSDSPPKIAVFSPFQGKQLLQISPGAAVLYSQSLSAGSGLSPCCSPPSFILLVLLVSPTGDICGAVSWWQAEEPHHVCEWLSDCPASSFIPCFLFEKVLVLFHPVLI